MKRCAFPILFLIFCMGCHAPQRVNDDIQLIQIESKAISDFNAELLNKGKAVTPEDLEKKLKLLTVNNTADQRVQRGLRLLQEYLGSIEFVNEAQLSITDEIIKKIADKVNEKTGN